MSSAANRGLAWAWAFLISGMSTIASVISADAWSGRLAVSTSVGFVAALLVARGLAGAFIRTEPPPGLLVRRRGRLWLAAVGVGLVSGVLETVGQHHHWETTATRVALVGAFCGVLYLIVEKWRAPVNHDGFAKEQGDEGRE